MAYRGRGGAGKFIFCCTRCFETETEGRFESSDDEDEWTSRRGGRAPGVVVVVVDIERGTTGEKLPGARCPVAVGGNCDMIVCG